MFPALGIGYLSLEFRHMVSKKSSKQQRIETAKNLGEKIGRAKTIAFADYHGLGVNQLASLRHKIKEAGGELLVAKNTLLRRALTINHLPFTINQLTGPTATIFAYEDEVGPIKEAATVANTLSVPKFKFGYFAGQLLDASAIERLATLPSRDVLLGKIVGTLSSPLYGIVSVLSANIRNLVSVLDQASKREVKS